MIHAKPSSSSSTLSIQRKVCMIFPAPYPEFEFEHGHDIFILDLNTDLVNLSSPTIRVVGECFRSAAFYVLGSTLYVFQGNDGEGRPRGKRVSKYDFSGHEGAGVITLSDKKDLTWVCRMNDIKILPVVIPTPDGKKIVVFSTRLQALDDSSSTSNFELFDPAEGNCKILPDLFRSPPLSNHIGWVELFSFLNKDILFVQTSLTYPKYKTGMYQLNLNLVDQGSCWEPFYIPEQLRKDDEFKVIGDDICLTPEVGLQINVPGFVVERESSNKNRSYELPRRPLSDGFSPPHDVFLESDIALLDNHPHDRLFCVLRKWLTEEKVEAEEDVRISHEDDEENKSVTFRYVPHVILDVYRCNIPACKKGMLELEEKQQREVFKAELEEKQQREKMMVELEEKQQREKLELEEKQQRGKFSITWKNKFVVEMDEFKDMFWRCLDRNMAEVDQLRMRMQHMAVNNDFLKNKRSLVELREKFYQLDELSEKIKRNWKKKNTDKQLLQKLVFEYNEKRVEYEEMVQKRNNSKKEERSKFVSSEFPVSVGVWEKVKSYKLKTNIMSPKLPDTVSTELREKIKSNKMKSNVVSPELPDTVSTELREKFESDNYMKSNVVVWTELPGTELVKSFQIEFDPQPPPPFILQSIFPLHNFFSIPT